MVQSPTSGTWSNFHEVGLGSKRIEVAALSAKYEGKEIEHFARECRAPRNKEGQFKNQDTTRKQGNNEDTSSKEMLAIDGVGFDWSDMAEEHKKESNVVCDKKSDDSKENSDNSLVKGQVSEDTSSFVESSLNVDKETIFLNKEIEFVKPKNHEKLFKKSV
ncbi:hypothetical protein Tco_0827689, partial [Tanacetum coccineum]